MLLDIRSQDLPNPILMSVEGGVYTVTTGTASMGIGLNAAKGTFAEAGGTATFGVGLNAGRGTYTELAGTATFVVGLNASKGIYSEVGGQATFVIGLNAVHGTYAETGGTATLGIGLSVSRGTYTESGGNVRFGVGMGVAGGIYTETGNPASLGIGLNAAGASYAETGGSATFVTGLNAASGSYTETGGSVAFAIGLVAESGTFTESGGSVTFAIGLQVGGGTIAIVGGPVTFKTVLTSLGGLFSYDVNDASFILSNIGGILFGGFLIGAMGGCGCCNPAPDCLMLPCQNCDMPKTDLRLEWTNPILGNGSTTLSYSSGTWTSGCSNELIYQLLCIGNQIEFRANYFISGPCPTGTRQYCSNLRPNPFRLAQTKLICGNNFEMDLTVGSTACPVLSVNGFTSFKITSPNTTGKPTPRCGVCFTVNDSCGPSNGATVTVSGGPGAGGTGITDSRGFVRIDIGQPGSYTVTVQFPSGRTTAPIRIDLACGQVYAIGSEGVKTCCDADCGDVSVVPGKILHITDSCLGGNNVFQLACSASQPQGPYRWVTGIGPGSQTCRKCFLPNWSTSFFEFDGRTLRNNWVALNVDLNGNCTNPFLGLRSSGTIVYTPVSTQCNPYMKVFTFNPPPPGDPNYPLYCGCRPTVTITL